MTAIRLIIANTVIFLIIRGVWLLSPDLTENVVGALALPSTTAEFVKSPWSAITYMFLHLDFWHLLTNTLWLAWFGALLGRIAGNRWVIADFIAGGLAGALCYLLLPQPIACTEETTTWLLGSSAATLSVIGATLVSAPDKRVRIPFIGQLSLKMLAAIGLGIFVCASLEMTASQTAAHAGGLAAGFISGLAWRIITRRKMETMKALTRERMEYMSLVEKARRSGYASLSRDEQLKLFNLSRHGNANRTPAQ